jgi:sialate O-acetylesterase
MIQQSIHVLRCGLLLPMVISVVELVAAQAWGAELRLSSLNLGEMTQSWSVPGIDKSVSGNPISIGGKRFASGIGTHAQSSLALDLGRAATRFSAQVGLDDETGGGGTVEFRVLGDGKLLWSSGIMKGKDAAKVIDVDLTGIRKIILQVGDANDGRDNDHADWGDAAITYQGRVPRIAAQSMPHIFSDNMVLQRDRPVPIWGWADPGETVEVAFGAQVKKATVDADGKWLVRLDAMPANRTGQDLRISGGDSDTFTNVLVGDVWVCSGQSNMEFGVGGSLNAKAEAAAANSPIIRFIHVPRVVGAFPESDFKASWQVATPAAVGDCTAVGYFFARELVQQLDVPMGLIHSNWGGTAIEPWICREGLAAVPELKDQSKRVNDTYPDSEAGLRQFQDYMAKMKMWVPLAEKSVAERAVPPPMPDLPAAFTVSSGQATQLYNGMIAPAVPYGIKGVLWYQGEANGGEGDSYFQKMKALVGGWRQVWKQGDFPFYFVQLANFQTSDPGKPEMGDGWARLREAQMKALTIPGTGMGVIIDIGEANDIHPKNKQDVGKRLAAWALARDYGRKGECSGPLFQKCTPEGGKLRITFDHADSGLMIGEKSGLEPAKALPDGKLKWLSIAGDDKKFYWADAVVDGRTLVVSSAMVANPVTVRYAFTNNPQGPCLYNKEGFPASPFRADSW